MVTAKTALLIAIIAMGTGLVGWGIPNNGGGSSTPSVPLGTWTGMPFSQTELMGNTSYRGVLRFTTASSSVGPELEVGCISPSNRLGATLQLQYANFTTVTNTNTSLFVNLGNLIPIDNSLNFPCPGVLLDGTPGNLPSSNTANNAYEFRVVGQNGGGSGDNPRFSFISVLIHQQVQPVIQLRKAAVSTTSFTTVAFLEYATSAPGGQLISFDWIAVNDTGTSCLSLSACIQHGTNTCTIPLNGFSCNVVTTFGTAFTNTPNVVISDNSAVGTKQLTVGTISLLSAQTLTV